MAWDNFPSVEINPAHQSLSGADRASSLLERRPGQQQTLLPLIVGTVRSLRHDRRFPLSPGPHRYPTCCEAPDRRARSLWRRRWGPRLLVAATAGLTRSRRARPPSQRSRSCSATRRPSSPYAFGDGGITPSASASRAHRQYAVGAVAWGRSGRVSRVRTGPSVRGWGPRAIRGRRRWRPSRRSSGVPARHRREQERNAAVAIGRRIAGFDRTHRRETRRARPDGAASAAGTVQAMRRDRRSASPSSSRTSISGGPTITGAVSAERHHEHASRRDDVVVRPSSDAAPHVQRALAANTNMMSAITKRGTLEPAGAIEPERISGTGEG